MIETSTSLNEITTNGCGCAACMSGTNSSDYYVDSGMGGDVGAPVVAATSTQFANYLTDGYWQDAYGAPSYNFEGWGSSKTNFTFSIGNWYSATEKAGIRDAFDQWADAADIEFTEVGSGGDIYFDAPGGGESNRAFAAMSWSVTGSTATVVNPVRIVIDYDSGGFGSDPTDLGNYALTTAIHEIGHALGLGHSGDYNAGQGNPTYNDAIWTNDTRQYSVMSYWSASNSGANHLGEYPSTPMIMDILAIQNLYGVDNTTRSGDTVYGFNSTAGRDQFDFTINVEPVIAIWDGGGTDTLDFSGWNNNQMINLNDGEFSNARNGTGNVSIAYNAVIENATGGGGNDSIYGNEVNNIITGNAGDDTIYGSTGTDTLNGGDGTDTLNYSYDISDFLITLIDSVTVSFQHIADSWIDTANAIENFIFNGSSYTFAELEPFDSVKDIGIRFDYSGGGYNYGSGANGNTTLTAANIGNSGTSGDAFGINRSSSTLNVNVLDADGATKVSFWGSTSDETINLTGTDATLGVYLNAKAGDDVISIASTITGADELGGGDGDDTIYASNGNDKIWGGGDNDTLYGGLDDDTIWGGTGNDIIYGDNQARTGQLGNDTLIGEAGNDQILGGDGNDLIYGGTGDDILAGDAGADVIHGDSGVDTIYGNSGVDQLYGGADGDIIYGGDDNDTLSGEAGNDTLYGDDGADYLWGHAGDDTLEGGDGNDVLYSDFLNETGSDGNDTLRGGAGNDTLVSRGGDDILDGGSGIDQIWAGTGNDTLEGGSGDDILNGGTGTDTVTYINDSAGVTVLLGMYTATDGSGSRDSLAEIENINGSTYADRLEGNGDANTINGNAGNDIIYGWNGIDTLNGGAGADNLYGGADADTIHGNDDNDILSGGTGNDLLYGDDGADYLWGHAGDDTLEGGDGNDVLYSDFLNNNINDGNDTLRGGAGNDVLVARGGNDILEGGTGVDQLWGGSGQDTFILDNSGSVDHILDFATGENDALDISDIISGFYTNPAGQSIEDFVQITDSGANSIISVDQDGGGNNFLQVGIIYNVTGLTDESALEASNNLITS